MCFVYLKHHLTKCRHHYSLDEDQIQDVLSDKGVWIKKELEPFKVREDYRKMLSQTEQQKRKGDAQHGSSSKRRRGGTNIKANDDDDDGYEDQGVAELAASVLALKGNVRSRAVPAVCEQFLQMNAGSRERLLIELLAGSSDMLPVVGKGKTRTLEVQA